jgi:integrase
MVQKLTDRLIKALERPASGNKIHYDSEVKGFGARVTAAGAVAFIVNYRRKADGLERRYTIGAWPDWSATTAREKAKELKRHIDGGGDPVGEHVAERAAPTVADLCGRFLEEHVAKQRPHTQADYGSMIRNDILTALGRLKVALVEFEHVERLHAAITRRAPVRANRVVAVLSRMLTLAIKWKLRSDNPCKGVERNREHLRKRYLKPEELARLTKALAEEPNQTAADAVRLLLLTGCRRGEALNAAWSQFNLAAGTWSKPPSSTKQDEYHQVPLSAPARQLLGRLHKQAEGSPWVFPGRNGRPREDLKYAWQRIRRAAGIPDVRLHDIRHSFASELVSGGASLPLIGALLGHSNPTTTFRYAHLYTDPQRAAVEKVGAIISGKPAAKVLPMKRRRRR